MSNCNVIIKSFYFADIDMMLLFESISVSLVPHWKDVGYQLELVFDDINQIAAPEQLPANHERKMLEMWMLSTPLNERRTRLIAALRVMGRLDIIQILGMWSLFLSIRPPLKIILFPVHRPGELISAE